MEQKIEESGAAAVENPPPLGVKALPAAQDQSAAASGAVGGDGEEEAAAQTALATSDKKVVITVKLNNTGEKEKKISEDESAPAPPPSSTNSAKNERDVRKRDSKKRSSIFKSSRKSKKSQMPGEGVQDGGNPVIFTHFPAELDSEQLSCLNAPKNTLNELLKKAYAFKPAANYIGTVSKGQIDHLTYEQAELKSRQIVHWLLSKGIANSFDTKIGLIANNSAYTRLVYDATFRTKMVMCPFYLALGLDNIVEIIKRAECSILICDCDDYMESILKLKNTPLKYIISLNNDTVVNLDSTNISIVSIENIFDDFKESTPEANWEEPDEKDYSLILSTSGSTGLPKLVLHTHKSMYSHINSIMTKLLPVVWADKENTKIYSILPEQHLLGHAAIMCLWVVSGQAIYPSDRDVRKVLRDDLKIAKPTILCLVPAILNRIRQDVYKKVKEASVPKQYAFNLIYGMSQSGIAPNFIKSRTFQPINEIFGNELKGIIVGGAPLEKSVNDFYEITLGVKLCQGYGLSEGFAVLTHPNQHHKFGCGTPLKDMQVKLVSVPEMGYFSVNNCGEIRLKGPNMLTGYYKDEELNKESFDEDGFFKTGDVGVYVNNTLKIIDRVKNIFKLSQGEYVCPMRIQEKYLDNPLLKDIYIYGHPTKSCLVAIAFFEPKEIHDWITKNLKNSPLDFKQDIAELIKDPLVVSAVAKELNSTKENHKLKGFEVVKAWKLSVDLPTTANNLLTVTMKQKRKLFEDKYQEDFDALYRSLESNQ